MRSAGTRCRRPALSTSLSRGNQPVSSWTSSAPASRSELTRRVSSSALEPVRSRGTSPARGISTREGRSSSHGNPGGSSWTPSSTSWGTTTAGRTSTARASSTWARWDLQSGNKYISDGESPLLQVKGVSPTVRIPPGAPKKADERCFFDLMTSQRMYSLCADTRQQAAEWQEKIPNCMLWCRLSVQTEGRHTFIWHSLCLRSENQSAILIFFLCLIYLSSKWAFL